jgi:HlyD family secretion protein
VLKRFRRALLLLIVAVVSYAGYTIYDHRKPHEWSGTVEAKSISLGSRAGGRVKDVLIHEGALVKKNEPLVVLEAGDLEARKMIAQADIDAAEAFLQKLSNGARPEELSQAQARLNEAKAATASAQSIAGQQYAELNRGKSLHATGAISQAEQDARAAAARASGANAMQASARIQEASAALKLITGGTRDEDLRAAKANVESAKGRYAIIQNQIDELTIKSPVEARVESVIIRPGDILRPDSVALTVLEESQLFVRIYVPETLMGRLTIGQQVPIYVDSFPKRSFTGTVEHINTVGEFTPRNLATPDERANEVFAARIALKDGHSDLRAGMAAFIKIKK